MKKSIRVSLALFRACLCFVLSGSPAYGQGWTTMTELSQNVSIGTKQIAGKRVNVAEYAPMRQIGENVYDLSAVIQSQLRHDYPKSKYLVEGTVEAVTEEGASIYLYRTTYTFHNGLVIEAPYFTPQSNMSPAPVERVEVHHYFVKNAPFKKEHVGRNVSLFAVPTGRDSFDFGTSLANILESRDVLLVTEQGVSKIKYVLPGEARHSERNSLLGQSDDVIVRAVSSAPSPTRPRCRSYSKAGFPNSSRTSRDRRR